MPSPIALPAIPAFLAEVARPPRGRWDPRALTRAARAIDDWQEALRDASAHAVVPALVGCLSSLQSSAIPSSVRDRLTERGLRVARANLAALATLARVGEALDAVDVAWALYKGPALALWLHNDVGARQFSDLDLLVAPWSVPAAADALRSIGYVNSTPINPRDLPAEGQLAFASTTGEIHVELHWAVVQRHFRVRLDIPAMIERAALLHVASTSVPTLRPDDHLLVLSVHHAKHRWERLQWISEAGEILVRSNELGVDIERVHHLSKLIGAERMVLLACDLPDALWGLAPHPRLLRRAAADPVIARLRRDVLERLSVGRGRLSSISERRAFQRRSRERAADRLWLDLSRVFTASLEDRRAFALPRQLRGLYIVLRPLRLVVSRLRRRSRRRR